MRSALAVHGLKLSVAKIFANWGWLLLALTYASTFIVILILAYTGNIPEFIQKIPSYDKIGHVVLYSLANYLGHRVLKRFKVKGFGWALPLWPLLFALFWLGAELAQLIPILRVRTTHLEAETPNISRFLHF
ncbi:hypothetical protein [Oscillatoria sp. FACHB-1406]|uniref:hypothetical protein n=1 Tax=Oscillatoria sp. FACHB-1406 TaxID=2692846 RepID=UPI0019BECEB7|nr:hypothetical protein [Oscillatoria sp. FACHB-1406]MBD2577671.1 hypothetical protein [Oscillatoria sp. FACHB-1406]